MQQRKKKGGKKAIVIHFFPILCFPHPLPIITKLVFLSAITATLILLIHRQLTLIVVDDERVPKTKERIGIRFLIGIL